MVDLTRNDSATQSSLPESINVCGLAFFLHLYSLMFVTYDNMNEIKQQSSGSAVFSVVFYVLLLKISVGFCNY